MFELIAISVDRKTNYDEYFLDFDYCLTVFNACTKCIDLYEVYIMSNLTGEIILEYNGEKEALTWPPLN